LSKIVLLVHPIRFNWIGEAVNDIIISQTQEGNLRKNIIPKNSTLI